jgi:hypothetical protein
VRLRRALRAGISAASPGARGPNDPILVANRAATKTSQLVLLSFKGRGPEKMGGYIRCPHPSRSLSGKEPRGRTLGLRATRHWRTRALSMPPARRRTRRWEKRCAVWTDRIPGQERIGESCLPAAKTFQQLGARHTEYPLCTPSAIQFATKDILFLSVFNNPLHRRE